MERLDGTVRSALRRVGVPDAGVLAEVTRAWPEVVGPAVARAAWPQRLSRDGTLHVTTISSTWAFELGRMADEVLDRLRARLGDATPPALRFAMGPVPAPGADAPAPPPDLSPTPAEEAEAASVTAEIDDPALRDAVRRAVAAGLAAARADRDV